MQRIQGVVVGDYGVGKTSLLYAMVGKPMPEEHVPTLLESHMVEVDAGEGGMVEAVLYDTPGADDHQQMVVMGLARKDAVIVCFSLVDSNSFKGIKQKWLPLIKQHLLDVPIVLVGTKLDLRNTPEVIDHLISKGTSAIDTEQGEELSKEIHAVKYIECSALNRDAIEAALRDVTRIAYDHKRGKRSKRCTLM